MKSPQETSKSAKASILDEISVLREQVEVKYKVHEYELAALAEKESRLEAVLAEFASAHQLYADKKPNMYREAPNLMLRMLLVSIVMSMSTGILASVTAFSVLSTVSDISLSLSDYFENLYTMGPLIGVALFIGLTGFAASWLRKDG